MWTRKECVRFNAYALEGASISEIARALGKDRKTVRRRMVWWNAGQPGGYVRWDDEERRELARMKAQGLTSRECAVKLNRTWQATRRVFAEITGKPRKPRWPPKHERVAVEPEAAPKAEQMDRGYVAAVMAHGGFCALSERQGRDGQPVVCLPVVWPVQAGRRAA